MFKRHLIVAVFVLMAFTSLSFAQIDQIAIFNEAVGWTTVDAAKTATDAIVKNVTAVSRISILNDADMGKFATAQAKDGNIDIIITFGYLPVSLYTPGNAQVDGSVGELFLEGGNIILNSADYIFYVSSAINGDAALKNMTDSTFDCWTDGNKCKPTADGKKYTPSLPADYDAVRCLRKSQIDADEDWDLEVAFGANDAGENADPAIILNKTYGGRVGIVFQQSNDALPRGAVYSEIINNFLITKLGTATAVTPGFKLASSWGNIKSAE